MFCGGPGMVRYLSNHLKFRKWSKNKENHDFTLLTDIPMAAPDA